MAPVKCSLLPLSNQEQFQPVLQQLGEREVREREREKDGWTEKYSHGLFLA